MFDLSPLRRLVTLFLGAVYKYTYSLTLTLTPCFKLTSF